MQYTFDWRPVKAPDILPLSVQRRRFLARELAFAGEPILYFVCFLREPYNL